MIFSRRRKGSSIPKPREAASLEALAAALDAASHEERIAWMNGLGGREMRHLYEAAKGNPVSPDDLVGEEGKAIHYPLKNSLPLFNKNAKVFARVGDAVVGYNRTDRLAMFFAGPGHFRAVPSTDVEGEMIVDYKNIPETTHQAFPRLRSNRRGLIPFIVYGCMIDVVRRVSREVFIGWPVRSLPGSAGFVIIRSPE